MMTTAELDALPVTFSLETAARALGVGRNQAYAAVKADRFPIRVLTLSGRYRVSKFDLLRFLGANSSDVPQIDNSAGHGVASGHADRRSLRPMRDGGGAA